MPYFDKRPPKVWAFHYTQDADLEPLLKFMSDHGVRVSKQSRITLGDGTGIRESADHILLDTGIYHRKDEASNEPIVLHEGNWVVHDFEERGLKIMSDSYFHEEYVWDGSEDE